MHISLERAQAASVAPRGAHPRVRRRERRRCRLQRRRECRDGERWRGRKAGRGCVCGGAEQATLMVLIERAASNNKLLLEARVHRLVVLQALSTSTRGEASPRLATKVTGQLWPARHLQELGRRAGAGGGSSRQTRGGGRRRGGVRTPSVAERVSRRKQQCRGFVTRVRAGIQADRPILLV